MLPSCKIEIGSGDNPRYRILVSVLRQGDMRPWAQFGVLAGLRVQLSNGLSAPDNGPTSTTAASPSYSFPAPPAAVVRFILRGREKPDESLSRVGASTKSGVVHPVMCATTSFHSDLAGRSIGEMLKELRTPDWLVHDLATLTVNVMHLKDRLRDIHTNCCRIH